MGVPLLAAAPTGLAGLIGQLLTQFVRSGRDDVLGLLSSYVLSTSDPSRPGAALTADPTLASLTRDASLAADSLLVLVVIALALRGIADRSITSQHELRAVLPRVLVGVVLMNAPLTLIQMAVDLDNALAAFASGLSGGSMPWTGPLAGPALQDPSLAGDLFHVLVLLALVIVVAILGFTYVVRMAVLQVLVVTAPLAALALIPPATRGVARAWGRLFAVVVFMQAAQLVVLSVAAATGLSDGSGLAADIYSLAALWVTLKVPAFLARAVSPGGSVAGLTHVMAVQAGRLPLPAPIRSW
jgi:hypothetical protein